MPYTLHYTTFVIVRSFIGQQYPMKRCVYFSLMAIFFAVVAGGLIVRKTLTLPHGQLRVCLSECAACACLPTGCYSGGGTKLQGHLCHLDLSVAVVRGMCVLGGVLGSD